MSCRHGVEEGSHCTALRCAWDASRGKATDIPNKRFVVWSKDDYFAGLKPEDRVDMDASGVRWEKELPLVWSYDFSKKAYGRAVNIEYGDGEITCELIFFDPDNEEQCVALLAGGDIVLGGYYKDIVKHKADDHLVTNAELKGVSMVLASDIPMRRRK